MSEPNTSEPLHSSCTRQVIWRAVVGEAWPRRRTGRPWCRRSAAGTPAGRAASPAPGTCRRSARTARGASSVSVVPNRSAMPGRCHTGSIAILTTETLPLACTTVPSLLQPAGRDRGSAISGRSSRARVIAMLGRMSMPSAISGAEGLRDQVAPRDRATRSAAGSVHCGNGPMVAAGWVLVRSGGGSGRARRTTPRARGRPHRSRHGCR